MYDPPDEEIFSPRADTPAPFSRSNSRLQVLQHSNPSFKLWHDMSMPEHPHYNARDIRLNPEQFEDSDAQGCPTKRQIAASLAFQGNDDLDGGSDCATPVKDACIRPFTPEQAGLQGGTVGQNGSPSLSTNLCTGCDSLRAPVIEQESSKWLRQHICASPLSRHLSLTSPPRGATLGDAVSKDLMHHLLSGIPKGLGRLRTGAARDSRRGLGASPATPLSHRAARRLKVLHRRTASGPWFEVNLEE